MQTLSDVLLDPNANHELVKSFMNYLLTLTPDELTTFYCEECHGLLDTDATSRPGNPYYEVFGRCQHCRQNDDVSNPSINRFFNERGLTLEHSKNLLVYVKEGNEQLIRVLQNWLTPTDYDSVTGRPYNSKRTPVEAWVLYGRKKEKEAYKSSSLIDVYRGMLLEFYPLCYSVDRFNTNPMGGKIDQEVVEVAEDLSGDEALPTWPSKPNPYEGWLGRVWAFFNEPVNE